MKPYNIFTIHIKLKKHNEHFLGINNYLILNRSHPVVFITKKHTESNTTQFFIIISLTNFNAQSFIH